jgi:murein DD-endopeptidase MepM/ murein hydrolase activator NlpD
VIGVVVPFVLAAVVTATTCWLPPVDAPVSDPFRPPTCAWCAGNRGIEYATPPETTVRAVASGVVTFSGVVAGVRYVVVGHAGGELVTYGGLAGTMLDTGDVVIAGAVVGTTAGPLHFGVREGGRYVDPAPYLGRLEDRLRLVPLDGSLGRPAPPPRLRCDAPRPPARS